MTAGKGGPLATQRANILKTICGEDGGSVEYPAATQGMLHSLGHHWNTVTLAYEVDTGGGAGSEVSVTNFPATQPVSGPLTDTQLRATAVPVSGTFWQATQPVSISGSVPVTGTFWQATQPVSGTVNPSTSAGKTIAYVSVSQSSAGTTQLAAASGSNKHKVVGCVLVMDAAGTLKFTDSSGDLSGAMSLAANAGFVLPSSLFPYLETGAVNRSISIVTANGAVKGVVALLTEP